MSEYITAEMFKEATGRDPQDDDLERVNCPARGSLLHTCCGWCYRHNKPFFECFVQHHDRHRLNS